MSRRSGLVSIIVVRWIDYELGMFPLDYPAPDREVPKPLRKPMHEIASL